MEIALALGGALLAPSFQLLIEKLTSVDLLNYAREGQVLDEIKRWDRMLKKIYDVLEDAEGRQMSDRRVKRWVSDLRDLAYDVEDILDDFNTELLRRKVEGVKPAAASTSKVRKLFPSCCGGMNPTEFKFNAEMVSKMECITAKLDEIVKDKDQLGLTESRGVRPSQVSARPPTSSLLPDEEVCGREKDKQAVLDLVKAQSINAKLSVIPIVGMGGVGKTTLAQLIYNHQSLHFDLKAWVCDGEDFDIYGITKKILKKLGGDADDLSSAQEKLKDKLSGNKFLIVVDDIWKENYENWTCFRAPFIHGAPGSILMVTTRSGEVSSMVGTIPAYNVDKLSTDDCLSVFAHHALGERNFDQHLDFKEIGNAIVKKCQGLPLAAKALGGLLRGKRSANVWQQVLKSQIWDLPDEKCNVMPALRLSYFHLPSHLKVCFAYCAIFPKDYEFDSKELILLWMAEGFLNQSKETMRVEELGDQYFCDLLSRSFFQPSSSNKSLFVMHDLINDLARSVSGEVCFQLGDESTDATSYAMVRHSSFLRRSYDVAQRFEVFYEMKSLRTFVALPTISSYKNHSLTGKVLHNLVPQLKCLRTLSLSCYHLKELPISIGALKHLRYLNLSYTEICKLPESVCHLINLQIMILRGCRNLLEFPKDINNLINLLCLDIRGTSSLKEMPPQISSLTCLHILSDFIVGKGEAGLGLNKLMEFSHLQGQLCISSLQNVVDFRDAEYANLKAKDGLKELDLEWIDEISSSRNRNDEFQVLKALQPHQNVSILSINFFGGMAFPSWMGDHRFSNIVQLKLRNCCKVTSLPSLGRLPSLKELSIKGMDGLKEVDALFYEDSSCFACLETLIFKNMREWERWSWSDGLNETDGKRFPNLLQLQIVRCPKLVGKLPSCLPSLNSLKLEGCQQLVDSPKLLPSLSSYVLHSCPEIVLRNMSNISCLTHLTISKISGLISLPEALIHALVALKELSIRDCKELVYLWGDRTNLDNLSCLKTLNIRRCDQLVSLVEGEVGLFPSNLEELKIWSCDNLKKLSNGLHYLTSLKVLKIKECDELVTCSDKGLPNSLKDIRIGCRKLHLKGITCDDGNDNHEQMYQLEVLKIRSCENLRSFPNQMQHFKSLQELKIFGCHLLESFPDSELPIPTLQILIIFFCKKLRSLPNQMQNLLSLHILEIRCCPLLESFPVSGLPLPSLTCLLMWECNKLRSLPNQIQNLTSLQYLEINKCVALCFPEAGLPHSLTKLTLCGFDNWARPLSELGLHRLTSLKELFIEGSNTSTDMIVSFPGNDGLLLPNSLTRVHIRSLKNLQSVSEGIRSLASLRQLIIWGCSELQSLPKEGLPATLEVLSLQRCPLMRSRCLKDKGELWPIISHIPYVRIDD